jgi:protein O-GlcNAc transferase
VTGGRSPSSATALLQQAEQALARGEQAAAEALWQRVLELDPGRPEALFHVGNRLRERGEHAAAIDCYERALRRAAGHSGLLNNLGLALEAIGATEQAAACYREVLAREPQHSDALLNLANLSYRAARYAEAAALHARAASVRRNLPPTIWVQRALALERVQDLEGAEASLREAARLAPNDVHVQANLATLLIRQRRHEEAEEPLRRALELDPQHAYALSTLAYVRQQRCAWEGLSELHDAIRRLLDREGAEDSAFNPFPLLAMPTSPRQRLVAARSWARGFELPASSLSSGFRSLRTERLRIGFVSSDFRPHATAYLLMELWERLDRTRVEAFAYAIEPPDQGPIGQRIAHAFEHFADVSADPTSLIVERIRTDRIALLFDLNGYTRCAREGLFAARPAPLQINAFGYLGSLGAPWYDYVLTDRFVCPASSQADFTERFLYLDGCYCPGDTHREIAAAKKRTESGLPAEGLVFCCFNSAYKLLPDVFAVWMRLLAAVPGSLLWLAPGNVAVEENLRREAAARGVDPNRLVFAPRVGLSEHLARHTHADLFLDTFPYNAGATANDALFMGVPVLTCAGDTMSSRVAGSQLHAIGLPDLITNSLGEYEALGLKLATQPDLLRGHRQRLDANRHTHPLFAMDRYARDFVDALERAWGAHAVNVPA